jgi:type I restriction-modification system DNA methylase subunit
VVETGLTFTQISFAAEVKKWIEEIIRGEGLKFEGADIEISDPKRKRADVILWEKREVKKPALLIEIWDAKTSPWEDALDTALSKAWKNNIPYFVVWNLKHFYCWSTFQPEQDALDRLWWPHLGVPEKVCDALTYEDAIFKYANAIKNYLLIFLREFEEVYYNLRPKPLLGIDERFIYRLRGTIDALSLLMIEEIKIRAERDPDFRRKLIEYFRGQGWTFKGSDEDFEKVSRQYVYLLVNKILFYNILRSTPNYRNQLPAIIIPEIELSGERLKEILNHYFNRACEVTGNYETIFLADFLDSITPPDQVVESLRDFIRKLGRYDFSTINYEILGNIFQRLIPEEERHKLGQYFTRSDVVDLIVGFCVRDADAKVLDGACGAGTFLVRSYVRKKLLNPSKTHKELIKELYGVDIAKFPAHLAIINLASRNLTELENYPNILHRDFFDVFPSREYHPEEYRAEALGKSKVKVIMPEYFDAVIMNPPYTRQEEMEDIIEEEKKKIHRICIEDWRYIRGSDSMGRLEISKRSSIYVYFFIHAARFLREGGRLGLITSNSWLDVDYGKDLQKFFLENFKIKAIIESKVERWFEDADINTAITILEKAQNPEERDNNLVRFVQLKKPLIEFIPPIEDESERWAYVDKLIELIESKEGYYEDDGIRIFTKKQKELWNEGYDKEAKEYRGSRWGKYIRAPTIFFKVLDRGKGLFIPLKEIAEIKRGFTTGANEFFYLTEEQIRKRKIEKEFWMHPLRKDEDIPAPEHVWKDKNGKAFKVSQYAGKLRIEDVLRDDGHVYWAPNYVIKSPRECKSLLINPRDLKHRVLLIHRDKSELEGTNVLKYIEWGESQGFNKRPTCSSRGRWYDLGERKPAELLFPERFWNRFIIFQNPQHVFENKDLYGVYLYDRSISNLVCALLNSTLNILFFELYGRSSLGQGVLDIDVWMVEEIPLPDPRRIGEEEKEKLVKCLTSISQRPISSIFEELGARSPEEVSLDKVKPDRRELDEIVMDKILGLTEDEQLEIYRVIIDLVKSRIEKAKSVREKERIGEFDVDGLVNSILKEVEGLYDIQSRRFPEDYIGECPCKIVEVPEGSKVEIGYDLEGPYVSVDGRKIRCSSVEEAKFIGYALLAGKTKISIPEDENILRRAVGERNRILEEAKAKVEELLSEMVVDKKLKDKIRSKIFKKLGIMS